MNRLSISGSLAMSQGYILTTFTWVSILLLVLNLECGSPHVLVYFLNYSKDLKNWWWECKLVQPLWRTVWRFLKKLQIELPYDPAIPLLGIHTEETRIERDTCTPMFITALFITARTWKQPRCPSANERIREL